MFYIRPDDPICLLAWEELKDKDDDTWERSMNSPRCHERSYFPRGYFISTFLSFPCSLPPFALPFRETSKIEFPVNTRDSFFFLFFFFFWREGDSFKILEWNFGGFFFYFLKSIYTHMPRIRKTRGHAGWNSTFGDRVFGTQFRRTSRRVVKRARVQYFIFLAGTKLSTNLHSVSSSSNRGSERERL